MTHRGMTDEDRTFPPDRARWGWLLGAFLGLTLLLRAPDLILGTMPRVPSAEALAYYWEGPFRLLSLDLFALVSLLALAPAAWARPARAAAVGSVGVLLAYETYEAVVQAALHRAPLFAADVSHVVGALHLLYNAASPGQLAGGVVGIGAAVALLGWGLPPLVGRLHRALRHPRVRRALLALNVVVWGGVAFAAATDRGIERQTYQAICLSTTECLVHNVQASRALRARIAARQAQPADSTYVRYHALDWADPPSVYLVVLESYGMALFGPEADGAAGRRLLSSTTDSLRAAGWHAASTQSVAPVFGGLSWLSVASVLLGTPVEHQPTYQMLRPSLPRYPHLVRLLERQGYTTATLQPPVRPRPGLSVRNPYQFDRTFYLADLDYSGPDYGWGIVPDQYSLSVAHEQFVEPAGGPFFLLFEAVTSHAPWDRPPPPIVADPQALNRASPERDAAAGADIPGPRSERDHLLRHLRYDWRILVDYLRTQAPPNSLVVVMGDHQPYFAEGPSHATPVHVLSRDEALVRRFGAHGFAPGLQPPAEADSLHHAGLYSLLVRTITAHDRAAAGRSAAPLSPYRPGGVERAALLPDPRP